MPASRAVIAHPAIKDAGDGVLLPLSVRRLRRYASTRSTRYCHLRVVSATGIDVRGRSGSARRERRGAAGRPRLADGHQWGWSRSADGRAAADGRLAAADAAVGARAGDGELAAGQHRRGRPAGAEARGCAEIPWCTVHNAQLVAADRPSGRRRRTRRGGARRPGRCGVVCPPPAGEPDEQGLLAGREQVRHVIRMLRELPEMSAQLPRLYVVTRRSQIVIAGRPAQPGAGRFTWPAAGDRRGESRAADHPDRSGRRRRHRAGGPGAAGRFGRGRDRLARWPLVHRATALPRRWGRRSVASTSVKHESDRMRATVRNPGDLRTMEFIALQRKTPGPGEVEIAIDASSLNFLDVLAALGRYPDLEGRPHQLGFDLGGVVSPSRRRRHRSSGRRSGGWLLRLRQRLLGHLRHLRRPAGRRLAARPGQPARPPLRQRVTAPLGTACAIWPE